MQPPQILWKSTTAVGCATYYCANGLVNWPNNYAAVNTVCRYWPPGNWEGEYEMEVPPLLSAGR